MYHDGVADGIEEVHLTPEGKVCSGYVDFHRIDGWTVHSLNPLTISPSVACRSCPSHGFIEGGRWRDA